MTDKQQRLPRFERDLDAAGSFEFTKRDLEILRHVAEHRFIRSEWLVKLVGGSRQQLLRRLNLLYHHGYLDRPICQLDYYHEGGSKSLVYGLASRGAGRLRRDLNMPFDRMDWTTRNKSIGRLFLEHTLMVSDYMAWLELQCREDDKARFSSFHELQQSGAFKSQSLQPRWKVSIAGRMQIGVVPDKMFALDDTLDDGTKRREFYFLEADTGTMPVTRSSTKGSSIEKKLLAYQATYENGIAKKLIGATPFIVSFLVTSVERTRHIVEVINRLKLRRRMFRIYFVKHGEAPERCDDFGEMMLALLPSSSSIAS
jgi:Replication-relaxation